MKYVWILLAVLILTRIDFVLRLFDQVSERIQNSGSEQITSGEEASQTQLVPVKEDLAIRTSPRKIFLTMLDHFVATPDAAIKDEAMAVLRNNNTMFSDKLDRELEVQDSYRWRDLLKQKNKTTYDFLLELKKSLKGQNQIMIVRVLSYVSDIDLKEFLVLNIKSGDTNCSTITYLGDRLPDNERYNELRERQSALDAFITSPESESQRKYAQLCALVLRMHLDKFNSPGIEIQDSPSTTPSTGTSL